MGKFEEHEPLPLRHAVREDGTIDLNIAEEALALAAKRGLVPVCLTRSEWEQLWKDRTALD